MTTAARAVTVPQLVWLTACVVLEDQFAMSCFSRFLGHVACGANASGCAVIISAGCIPIIVECLHHWPADVDIVPSACRTLLSVARYGSATVRSAIKCLPGIVDTLHVADASGLAGDDSADALELLGFSAAEVSVASMRTY